MPRRVIASIISGSSCVLFPATVLAATPHVQACVGAVSDTKLIVRVDRVQSGKGLMAVTLYPDDPDRFLKRHGSLKVVRVPARSPTTVVCLYLPGPGGYGVAVYHDENGNRRLDKTGFLPAEGAGLSNNPRVNLFHLPSLKRSRFVTQAGANRIEIRLRYP